MENMDPPYQGKYLYFRKKGIYQCIQCGTALFCSCSKFDSGCGWPNFWETINQNNIIILKTKVICRRCNKHLGYVFNDGPPEKTGKRYCIKSSALSFIGAKNNIKSFRQ